MDSGALLRAAVALSARHPALRTTFAESCQRVHASLPPDLEEEDATAWSTAELDQALRREARRRFDLGQGSPLRIRIFMRPEGERVLLLVLHHLAGDFWSLAALLRDWAALYAGRLLPDLSAAYTDFVRWQRRLLAGPAGERLEHYWLARLRGAPLTLDLPADRPRPPVAAHAGALLGLRLDPEMTGRLRGLARAHGATLFTTLLAAFQTLLGRLTGQEDLLVGSPTTGRRDRDLDGVVGYFVNPVVLRADLAGDPPFAALLARSRRSVAEALAHRDLPFAQLTRRLQPARDPGRPPVFQVQLALQQAAPGQEPGLAAFAVGQAGARIELEGLVLESLRLDPGTAQLDLTLFAAEVGDALVLSCEHDTALFDAVTIARWLGNLRILLAAAAASPETRLGDLPLLTSAERHQALAEWNDTGAEGDWEGPVTSLVESRARERPEDPAVVDEAGRELTYRELSERAGRLAAFLRAQGVGPEDVVGVLAGRTPELPTGLLGVLKAGAAYLPLDPSYPAERLALMLAETAAPVVLTQEALLDRLPETRARPVCLDRDWDEIARHPPVPAVAVEPEHLAYVLYTSGSTGRPKGVQIPHRGLMNLVRWDLRAYGTGPGDRRTQVASLGFDASVWEIWPCLASGAALHLPDEETRLDPQRLAAWMAARGITVSFLPTPLAEALLTAGGTEIPTLRWLLVGGDRLRLHPDPACGFALVNHYGPTEASVVTSAGLVPPRPRGEPGPAPSLGRPIEGLRVFLLDRSARPVPPGVPGELWVGGPSLARGYLRDPGRTAERFAPDPIGQTPGKRLYRTSDLCRHRRDGSLEFLGRIDHQVKIRGFRIELGEIEAALAMQPGVRQAVAVVREGRLVAYVVGDATAATLRQALREQLPDYMVPAALVALDALPLSPSGKVDRAALAAPDLRSTREHVAPRTREEEVLAGVWAQVLRLSRVGVDDNFFELGGDSILSLQIVARAREAGLLVTVRQVFEHQTVAELARHAAAAGPGTACRSEQGPVVGEVPLTPIQRWFFAQGFADVHWFNQAVLLEPAEPLDPAALEQAMAAVVEHHDALRLRFRQEAGGWRQENAAAEPVTPFHRIDLSALPEPRRREALDVAAAALQTGFDLSAGPLTRLALFESTGALLWIAHHLVVDAVSWRVLLEDLERAYRQAPLPPKTTSFQEWARRLPGSAGVPPAQAFIDNLVRDEATVTFELTAEETADLLQTVPAVHHNRIDEALLSALARAVAGWNGSPQLLVDLERHGREPLSEDIDVSRTVGWFTTIQPVVLQADRERLRNAPGPGGAADISFNYLGRLDAGSGLFRPALVLAGSTRSPRAHRTHLLDVTGFVADGRLRMTVAYSSRVHRRETAERLAAAYARALRELIRHCRDWRRSLKDAEAVYLLSPLQEGLLLHSLMAPDSGVYVNQVACTLPADLDPLLFRRAWETLVERHGALRTAFVWDGLDEPRQVVHRSLSLPWQELDWRGLPADEQRRRFEELRHHDRHTPLRLDEAPLLRFSLVRLDGEPGFIWTFHHLLLDGWSVALLVRELGAVYTALREEWEPALPPVQPFGDYISWLQRRDLSRAELFWREELAGFAEPTPLGIDHPADTSGEAEHASVLSHAVTAGLQALAARHKLTLQTVTLGAWAVLLNRYSGEEDVVFGSVVSGRPAALPGVETMVGLFINTVPVRVRVDGGEPLGLLAAGPPGAPARPERLRAHAAVPHSAVERGAFRLAPVRNAPCVRELPRERLRRPADRQPAQLRGHPLPRHPGSDGAGPDLPAPDCRPRPHRRDRGVAPAPAIRRAARRHGRGAGAPNRRDPAALGKRAPPAPNRVERHGCSGGARGDGAVRGTGAPLAGGPGRGPRRRRRDGPHLRRARPSGEPPGRAPADARGRSGGDGGAVRRAHPGAGGGGAGDLQVRRRAAGAGSRPSAGPAGLPAGRCGGFGAGHPGAPAAELAVAWCADRSAGGLATGPRPFFAVPPSPTLGERTGERASPT